MKQLILFILICGCATAASSQAIKEEDNLKRISWLLGKWDRTNVKPGKTASERWEKISDREWKGYAVSLRGKDTVYMEKIRIIIQNNWLFYEADVPGNKAPVYFKFTTLNEQGFACENPGHDFPKKIEYKLKGDSLLATISGDGKAMHFTFKRE